MNITYEYVPTIVKNYNIYDTGYITMNSDGEPISDLISGSPLGVPRSQINESRVVELANMNEHFYRKSQAYISESEEMSVMGGFFNQASVTDYIPSTDVFNSGLPNSSTMTVIIKKRGVISHVDVVIKNEGGAPENGITGVIIVGNTYGVFSFNPNNYGDDNNFVSCPIYQNRSEESIDVMEHDEAKIMFITPESTNFNGWSFGAAIHPDDDIEASGLMLQSRIVPYFALMGNIHVVEDIYDTYVVNGKEVSISRSAEDKKIDQLWFDEAYVDSDTADIIVNRIQTPVKNAYQFGELELNVTAVSFNSTLHSMGDLDLYFENNVLNGLQPGRAYKISISVDWSGGEQFNTWRFKQNGTNNKLYFKHSSGSGSTTFMFLSLSDTLEIVSDADFFDYDQGHMLIETV